MVAHGRDDGRKVLWVAERAALDFFEDPSQGWIQGPVAAVGVRVAEVFDVFSEVAKEEDVFIADFAGDFDLFTVSI